MQKCNFSDLVINWETVQVDELPRVHCKLPQLIQRLRRQIQQREILKENTIWNL